MENAVKRTPFFPWILIIAVSLFTVFSGSAHTFSDPLVLKDGFLIDGTGGKPVNDAVVVIENSRISAAGATNAVKIPLKAKIINLKGATVLPGFINAHVHDGFEENNLRTWAYAGVTTVRDLGVIYGNRYNEDTFRLRDKLRRDNNNARLVAAGPMVTVPRGYGSYFVLSPEDARLKINKLIDDGADIIKIGIEDDLHEGQAGDDLALVHQRTSHRARLAAVAAFPVDYKLSA